MIFEIILPAYFYTGKNICSMRIPQKPGSVEKSWGRQTQVTQAESLHYLRTKIQ